MSLEHPSEPPACAACGQACTIEPSATDRLGARFVYACPQHGIQSVVDPFEGRR